LLESAIEIGNGGEGICLEGALEVYDDVFVVGERGSAVGEYGIFRMRNTIHACDFGESRANPSISTFK
jgi:hypothetical protein